MRPSFILRIMNSTAQTSFAKELDHRDAGFLPHGTVASETPSLLNNDVWSRIFTDFRSGGVVQGRTVGSHSIEGRAGADNQGTDAEKAAFLKRAQMQRIFASTAIGAQYFTPQNIAISSHALEDLQDALENLELSSGIKVRDPEITDAVDSKIEEYDITPEDLGVSPNAAPQDADSMMENLQRNRPELFNQGAPEVNRPCITAREIESMCDGQGYDPEMSSLFVYGVIRREAVTEVAPKPELAGPAPS